MRMADHSYSPQWALKDITYFDHETHRFLIGDLEIDGNRIHAITPPGASRFEHAIPAREWVCIPGLIRAQAGEYGIDGQFERWLGEGTTTAGILCLTVRDCIAATTETRLHVVTRLILNPFARARSELRQPTAEVRAPDIRALKRLNALVHGNGGCLSIAMHCPSIVSAYELVYAQNVAAAMCLNLSFELSADPLSAQSFRERFYSSETHLLDYLQLLRPGIAVFGLSQLTRADIDILVHSGAEVPELKAISSPERRTRGRAHARIAIAPAASLADSPAAAPAASRDAVVGALSATDRDADARVDAVTVSAAAALGERNCGRIAPGMRADLCVFAPPVRNPLGGGSQAFLQLLESHRPDAVIVGGALAHGEWVAPMPGIAGANAQRTYRGGPALPLPLSP